MTEGKKYTTEQILDGIKWYKQESANMTGVQKMQMAWRIAGMLENNQEAAKVFDIEHRTNPSTPEFGDISRAREALREQKFLVENGGRTSAGVAVVERPVTEQLGFLKSCGEYAKKLCKQIDNAGYQVVQSVKSMFSGNQQR